MSEAPAADNPEWLDEYLRPLMRGKLDLPVATAERSRAAEHRRVRRIISGFTVALIAIFSALLFSLGAQLPLRVILIVTVGIPLAFAVVMYGSMYLLLVRKRRDDEIHPWKLFADARGMSLERANGSRIGAPWEDWRYEGYIYGTVRHQRFVKALDLSLDGEKIRVDFMRTPGARKLARAILHGLVSAGQ